MAKKVSITLELPQDDLRDFLDLYFDASDINENQFLEKICEQLDEKLTEIEEEE